MTHYPMRRAERSMSREEALAALQQAEYGVLSVTGADGEAYGVPLSFAISADGGALLFHCAVEGRKLSALRAHAQAHFTAVAAAQTVPEALTVAYTCVMVEGKVSEVSDPADKQRCAQHIAARYAPGLDTSAYAARAEHKYVILRMDIEELSGKHRPRPGAEESKGRL